MRVAQCVPGERIKPLDGLRQVIYFKRLMK